jgi:hypothetical protein
MSSDEKPVRTQLIRVAYPNDAGRIALRTEENWDLDIKANSIQQNGAYLSLGSKQSAHIFISSRFCSAMAPQCGRVEKIS